MVLRSNRNTPGIVGRGMHTMVFRARKIGERNARGLRCISPSNCWWCMVRFELKIRRERITLLIFSNIRNSNKDGLLGVPRKNLALFPVRGNFYHFGCVTGECHADKLPVWCQKFRVPCRFFCACKWGFSWWLNINKYWDIVLFSALVSDA